MTVAAKIFIAYLLLHKKKRFRRKGEKQCAFLWGVGIFFSSFSLDICFPSFEYLPVGWTFCWKTTHDILLKSKICPA